MGRPAAAAPHGPLHQRRLLHAAAVVRKTDDLRRQSGEIDQLAGAALSHRDTTVGIDAYDGIAPDRIEFQRQCIERIGRRPKIGHGAHGRITSVSRSGRTGSNGLLLREAGLPQMDMHVDQPGNEPTPAEVDARILRRRFARSGDASVLHDDRTRFESSVAPDLCMSVKGFHTIAKN